MCHGSNSLWAADEVDERLVEKPVAPGGATGGVEFEAMNYVVSFPFLLLASLCHPDAEVSSQEPGIRAEDRGVKPREGTRAYYADCPSQTPQYAL